jgi:hypothetical protein
MGLTDIERRRLKGGAAEPDLAELPVRVTRMKAAELLTRFFFETSPRTLERWPLAWRRLNGKAHCETAQLFEVAESKLAEAPPVMGGARLLRGSSR